MSLGPKLLQRLNDKLNKLADAIENALVERYGDMAFRRALRYWMRHVQGWELEGRERQGDLKRAAKTAAYLLLNSLLFYEYLRRFLPLRKPEAPKDLRTAQDLGSFLSDIFKQACRISGFELVFADDEDKAPLSTRELFLLSDVIVEPTKELLEAVVQMNLPRLPPDAVAQIFSSFHDGSFRSQHGISGADALLANLVAGFCVRDAEALVFDPAAGAGDLLAAAYIRKRHKGPHIGHKGVISQLYGVERLRHLAQLAAVKLATQDATGSWSDPTLRIGVPIPQVYRGELFDIFPGDRTENGLSLPPYFDAILSRAMASAGRRPELEDEARLDRIFLVDGRDYGVAVPEGVRLLRRADVCFWIHSAAFLRRGGHMGLLTDGLWLDGERGAALQKFLLDNFRIIAIIGLEPEAAGSLTCGKDARAIAVLARESDGKAREDNQVKFVQLKSPLSDMIGTAEDASEHQDRIDRFVEQIEAAQGTASNSKFLVHVVRQRDLYQEGIDLTSKDRRYAGARWSKYLKAPEVFFSILERGRDKLCRLGDVAYVRFGIKTGANEFFYLKDVTDALSDDELRSYGLRRVTAQGGPRVVDAMRPSQEELRVVEDGRRERHVIESQYLRPVIKSPREIHSIAVDADKLKHRVFAAQGQKLELRGRHALAYIKHGERLGYDKRSTCAERARWWELNLGRPGHLFWRKTAHETHSRFYSCKGIFADQRLYLVQPQGGIDVASLAVLLNTTVASFFAELWGKVLPREGALDCSVREAENQLIIDPRKLDAKAVYRLQGIARGLFERPALSAFAEVAMSDRMALDLVALEILGFKGSEERHETLRRLYEALLAMVQARLDQNLSRHKRRLSVVAAKIWQQFDKSRIRPFPEGFLPGGKIRCETVRVLAAADIRIGAGLLDRGKVYAGGATLELGSISRAEFLKLAVEATGKQQVEVPCDAQICRLAVSEYKRNMADLEKEFIALASSVERERKAVRGIVGELKRIVRAHMRVQAASSVGEV